MKNSPLHTYDTYIVAFSGGKDSIACFLYLLEQGIPKEKIELWHHLVDGKGAAFMDWEVTADYCRKFAKHFEVPIYFSWKDGGFKREMLRKNSRTAPTFFEIPYQEYARWRKPTDLRQAKGYPVRIVGGSKGQKSTRLKYPQLSPNLAVRWCSAYLKIDVCATAIRNQKRFIGKKVMVLSGERGEESKARGNYAILEADKADLRDGKKQRYVDRHRPIRDWTETKVWELIKRYQIVVHPCYYIGYSRCSCKFCIFGNADQFRSSKELSPKITQELIDFERQFGYTLKRSEDLASFIAKGEPYDTLTDLLKIQATSTIYYGTITTSDWQLPAGAYKAQNNEINN